MDDSDCAGLAAIEADIVRPHAVGKRFVIEERSVPFVDLQPEFSLAPIPVISQKTRQLLHSGGFLGDGFSVGYFLVDRFLVGPSFWRWILGGGDRQKH